MWKQRLPDVFSFFWCFIILDWSFVLPRPVKPMSDLLTPISTSKQGTWRLAFFRSVTYLWICLEHSIWLFKLCILMKNNTQVSCVQQMGPFTWRSHWHFGRGFPECGQMFVPESSLAGLEAVHVTLELFYLSSHTRMISMFSLSMNHIGWKILVFFPLS